MRIGFFTEIYKPVLNGVVVSIESFREQMEALGHEVYVLTPSYMEYEDARVLPYHSLPLPSRTPYRLTIPLRKGGRAPRLDVVHAQSPFATGLLALRYARHYGVPLVFTYHTRLVDYSHYLPVPAAIAKPYLVWVSRTYANWADRVVVPSRPIQSLLESYGVTRPIEVVPTRVRLRPGSPADGSAMRSALGIPPSARVLINVGRLAQEKNVGLLLEAFARASDPARDHLLLVGDGPLRAPLENLARELGVEGRVLFAGYVQRDRIAACYAASDLFVFTSLTETQGLVVDEAVQAGLPVLAIAEGGVAEVATGVAGARLVQPSADRDTLLGDFASALRDTLASLPSLQALAMARDGARDDDSVHRLLALYQQAQLDRPIRASRSLRRGLERRL